LIVYFIKKYMETANFFWHDGKLSLYEQACLTSFLKMGFKVVVWSYNYIHLPEGAKLQNAQSILDQEHLTKYTQDGRNANLAAFSDVFRVTLTNKKLGEWWFDMDCICLKNADEFTKLKIDRDIVIGWEDNINANGAVLSIPNKKVAVGITNMQKNLCDTIKNLPWGTIGPKLLTNFCAEVGIQDQILPIEIFYPVHYTQTSLLFDIEKCFYVENLCKNSYTCHIWNEMLNRNNINKNEYPPVGSFLHKIFNEQIL
jgi:hypothetical protein